MSVRTGTTELLSYAAGSTTGSCRTINEDALGVFAAEHDLVVVVVDGCGGRGSGRPVADLVVAHVGRAAGGDTPDAVDPPQRADPLVVAIERANAEAFRRGHEDPRERGAGAAVCAARVTSGTITIAHVGDSRAARVRGAELEWMTEDHTLVAAMLRSGALAEADVADFPHKNVIVRAVGAAESVCVDVRDVQVRRGDVWMLCTDGIHGQVAEGSIAEILADRSRGLAERCQALLDASEAAGGHDSATLVIFESVGPPS